MLRYFEDMIQTMLKKIKNFLERSKQNRAERDSERIRYQESLKAHRRVALPYQIDGISPQTQQKMSLI